MSKPTNSINKIKDTNNVVHEIVPHSLTDGNYQVSLPELKSDIVVPYNTLQGVSNCYDTSTTDTAGTWTTSIPNITELTEGLTIKIRLKTNYNGTTNTLNVNGLGAKTIYFRYGNKLTSHYGKESVLALTYTSNAISSGTDRSGWIVENIYDSTNTFQLRKYYSRYTTKSALYRYMICFVNRDNLLIPANNVNNSTANNKTLTTDSFDLSKGIYYYNSTTTVAAGKLTGTAILYQQIGLLDLRYSFNTGTTLVANKPVYLVVTPSGGYGEVILATNPIAQELPTASDGNRYVFLGYAYDNYRIELTLDHPIYVYNSIKETYVSEDYSQDSNIKKNATDILNINNSISNLENNKVSKDAVATSTNLGLVKSSTTGITANRDYNVQVNSDGTMKVNVPWTDTTYTFNGAVSTIKDSNLTASRVLISNSSGKVAVSDVTSTELGYLDGVTSNVQTQLNAKANDSGVVHTTGNETISGQKKFTHETNSVELGSVSTGDSPIQINYDNNNYYAITLVNAASNSTYKIDAEAGQAENYYLTLPSKTGTLALRTDIPTVNNATLTIQKNGTNVATFTANSSTNQTANITVPTKVSELTNDSGYLTSHQDISGKVNKSGDTMTGSLTISSGSITAPQYNDAHNWPVIQVVDDSVTKISNSYTSTRIYSDTQPEWWLMGSSQGVLALKSDIPSSLKNPNALTFGSKTYDGSTAQTITASDLDAVSKSDAITNVTWTDTAGELNFKNSAGTIKSTITLPIKHYFGTTYGECYTIDAPNAEYSMQIGESGFTVDREIPGYDQVSNILQVNPTTFTYMGHNVLHANNIPAQLARFYNHSSTRIELRGYANGTTYRLIIKTGTASVTGKNMNTINLNETLPNTSYMVILTERTNLSRNAYIPIVRGKTESTFMLYLSTSGTFSYDYMVICMA